MSYKIFRLAISLFMVLALTAIASVSMPARAAGPWYVTTTGNDNNDCLSPGTACSTINGALAKQGFVPGDTIRVAIGTYTGTGYEVVLLDKDATLSGGWNSTFTTQSGMSTIDGQGARRGVTVKGNVTAAIERFVAQNGNAGAGNDDGGGIYMSGFLTLNNSVVSTNSANSGGGINNFNGTLILNNSTVSGNTSGFGTFSAGGGIFNWGVLTLNNSTVNGNTSSKGGGIYSGGAFAGGILTLNNSTVSGNTAPNGPGGGNFGGGIYNFSGTLTLSSSTISANSATSGGGIYVNSGIATMKNTLLAGNSALGDGPDCFSSISSGGYNLVQDATSCTISGDQTGNLIGQNPNIGPLQNNGGLTFTHALLSGSPTIDAGNTAGCKDQNDNLLPTDQRGITRPQGTRCDIGAFELEASGGGGGTEVSIDIKPGSQTNPINMKSAGKIPVAILSTPDFNAVTEIDRTSLTFGSTGDEHSLVSCNKSGTDINGDGLKDLICHFKTKLTAFKFGDTEGILGGLTLGGVSIEARDVVRVLHTNYP